MADFALQNMVEAMLPDVFAFQKGELINIDCLCSRETRCKFPELFLTCIFISSYSTLLKGTNRSSKQTRDKVKQDTIFIMITNKTAKQEYIYIWIVSMFQNR